MVKAPQGLRHRTRKLFKKGIREKGAIPPLGRILIEYRLGDKVYIGVNPAIHGGMPHRRYIGKVGKVVGFRGRAVIVEVEVGSKTKRLILLPEHIKPAFEVNERINEIFKKLAEISKIRIEQRKTLLKLLGKQK